MSKYLKRLAARTARDVLREAAKESKNWIVSKRLILETEEGDLELDKGEVAEIGATPEGDMAIQGQAACVIITDPELAQKIADIVVSSDELSDVKFVEKPALDAVMDGEEVDDVIDSLADDEDDNVEVAEVDVEQKESVEAKFAKFSSNRMNPARAMVCESILIDEADESPIRLSMIKTDRVKREAVYDYNTFTTRVSELNGSIQPGDREIALSENGKVIGSFDKAANNGMLFLENEFEGVEEMDSFDPSAKSVVEDFEFGAPSVDAEEDNYGFEPLEWLNKAEAEGQNPAFVAADLYDMTGDEYFAQFLGAEPGMDKPVTFEELRAHLEGQDKVESCSVCESVERILKSYEESKKSGNDYARMTNLLAARGLKESVIAKIVTTFDNKSLKECVRCFDSKYGKYVATFKESVDADNFIEETKDAKRFTKRFFA